MAERICRPCTYTLDLLACHLERAVEAAGLLREELKENSLRYEHRKGYRPSAKAKRRQARIVRMAREAGVTRPKG